MMFSLHLFSVLVNISFQDFEPNGIVLVVCLFVCYWKGLGMEVQIQNVSTIHFWDVLGEMLDSQSLTFLICNLNCISWHIQGWHSTQDPQVCRADLVIVATITSFQISPVIKQKFVSCSDLIFIVDIPGWQGKREHRVMVLGSLTFN